MSMSSLKFLFSNGGKAASENDEVFALAEAKLLAWSKSKIIIYNASELSEYSSEHLSIKIFSLGTFLSQACRCYNYHNVIISLTARGRWDPWPDDVDVVNKRSVQCFSVIFFLDQIENYVAVYPEQLLIFMDILAINFDSSRHYAIVGKLIGRTPKQVGGLIKTSCDKYDITFPMTRETRSARDAMGRSVITCRPLKESGELPLLTLLAFSQIIQGEGSLGQCNKFVQIVFFNVESPYGDLTDPKVVKESAKKMSRNARPADKEDLEKSTQVTILEMQKGFLSPIHPSIHPSIRPFIFHLFPNKSFYLLLHSLASQLVLSTVINGQKDIMNAIQNLSLKFDSAATHDDLATSTADAGATVATGIHCAKKCIANMCPLP